MFVRSYIMSFSPSAFRTASAFRLTSQTANSRAGNHSEKSSDEYLRVCRRACLEASLALKEGKSALEVVAIATCVLENSPLTNAGLGSNLTWDGTVECDAMVMDGRTLHHGAVGSVSGVKNPVNLARHLCEQQSHIDVHHGRIRPSMMVGEGAHSIAVNAGLETVANKDLITARSHKIFTRYKDKIETYEKQISHRPRQAQLSESEETIEAALETVGAVCVDGSGHSAAACSSGGIVLKSAGRLGQAAAYGCGCWAQQDIATSTTGCGEYLVRTMLARQVAQGVVAQPHDAIMALHKVVKDDFLESPFLAGVEEKLAGVILATCNPKEKSGEFLWAHTTQSMCIGHMVTTDKRPKSRMSRLSSQMTPGSNVVIEGIKFHLS